MGLRHKTCDIYFLRDKSSQSSFLMSTDNKIDPGEVLAYLLALMQVKEMIITCSHVQILVYQYQSYQYYYSRHYISFIQNNIKIVTILCNLSSKLDIIVLQLLNQVIENNPRYQSQFQADFRVQKGHIMTWPYYLKANYSNY